MRGLDLWQYHLFLSTVDELFSMATIKPWEINDPFRRFQQLINQMLCLVYRIFSINFQHEMFVFGLLYIYQLGI